MENEIMIRKAEKKDIPRLLELLLQVDDVHHRGRPDLFNGGVTKYNAEQLEEILERDDVNVFVCEDKDGRVTGHAFCVDKTVRDSEVLTDVKTLYIDDLCVDESARGKGVGKILYDCALGFAKSTGCHNVTLHVWDKNPGARAFYQKMGMGVQQTTMEVIL